MMGETDRNHVDRCLAGHREDVGLAAAGRLDRSAATGRRGRPLQAQTQLDTEAQMLEVRRLENSRWAIPATRGGDEEVLAVSSDGPASRRYRYASPCSYHPACRSLDTALLTDADPITEAR